VARHCPGPKAALPGEDREGSVHTRGIYPVPWFTGLCGGVPPRPRDASLLCPSWASPRTAVAGCLQPPPHGDARAVDSELSSWPAFSMMVNLLMKIDEQNR